MGIVAPIGKDPPLPEFVPSPVRSGSARITFQLHAHIYTSSVKLHYNTTKTQTTTTTITIHIATFGMFRGKGGGGAATNIKDQSLWSFTQKIMEYQWVCCPLSSILPLPHPPDSSSLVPAYSDREDVQNSKQEEPLPLLHHWNLLPIRLFHHWKTQVRYPLLHHWKTLLLSPPLRNRVSDCIHIWS